MGSLRGVRSPTISGVLNGAENRHQRECWRQVAGPGQAFQLHAYDLGKSIVKPFLFRTLREPLGIYD